MGGGRLLLNEHVLCVAITFKMSQLSFKSVSNFALSLNISPWELFGWFWRLQLWATGDWKPHHLNTPAHASRLMQSFFGKYQITQVTQTPYSPDLGPCDFWLFPRGRDFRPLMRFRKIPRGSWWQLGELCEVPRCLLWRGMKCHCPMYNVSFILYLLQ